MTVCVLTSSLSESLSESDDELESLSLEESALTVALTALALTAFDGVGAPASASLSLSSELEEDDEEESLSEPDSALAASSITRSGFVAATSGCEDCHSPNILAMVGNFVEALVHELGWSHAPDFSRF